MFIKILLVRLLFANLWQFALGMGNRTNGTITEPPPEPPSCASRCMVDSMFATQCLDTRCLCNEKDYQRVCIPPLMSSHTQLTLSRIQSLFQCLYSQCDTNNYGPALSHSISLCMNLGAVIYMVAPGVVDNDILRSREDDYLAGREVADVPGLQLRQESIAGHGQTTTVTTTVTDFITVSYAPVTYFSTASSELLETTQAAEEVPHTTSTSANRPWVVPISKAASERPSFFGLVLWIALVVALDYWMNS
ncbi:uncharacterized protein F4822DRAFT_425756 [Hypoxylon trugodes]|uniref:uncharacterized protein n=1 Tax=Hypoxylon trugodes TaxID=326681 RepID=UPI0021991617|nr:uncharacterized protein F4822DRAFT_425756 [Hypoxylon trugodes]KAI1392552.1 hypothetical protein F4822DRAFT_425756 [Hypoxylon trugodes]